MPSVGPDRKNLPTGGDNDPLDRVFRRLDAVCEMVAGRRNRKGGCIIGNLSTALSDTQSMIAIGLHINEASCDLIERSVHDRTLPASYHSYQMFSLTVVNPKLDMIAFQGARFLEKRGYLAYPFPANMPHMSKPSAEYLGGPGDASVPVRPDAA